MVWREVERWRQNEVGGKGAREDEGGEAGLGI